MDNTSKKFTVIYKSRDKRLMKTVRGTDMMDALAAFETWAKGSTEHTWQQWSVNWIFPEDSVHGAVEGRAVRKPEPQQEWIV